MKKLQIVLGLGAIGLTFMLNSCSDTTTNPVPNITYDETSPIVLGVGEDAVTLTGTIVAKAKLKQVTIHKTIGLSEELLKTITDFESGTITTSNDSTYTFRYDVTAIDTTTIIKITALDKDDQEASKSIVIQITEGIELTTFTAVLMGAQSNTDAGSTASLTTGVVYSISGNEAKDHSDMVDIVYYFGSKLAALYSPSQSDIQNVILYDITNWSTINDTKLGFSSLSATEFDAVTLDTDLETAGTPTLDVVPELGMNDVIVFETDSGKKGVFKVTDLTTGNTGSIEISVKVEP